MSAPRILPLIAALVITAPIHLVAQEEPPIAPGDRVRVTAWSVVPGRPVGTVLAFGADTCVLQLEGRAEPLALPLASVTRLEVSRGQKSNAISGALVGGALGAGIALFGSTIAWLNSAEDFGLGGAAYVVGVLGGAGAGIGLLLGATSYTDRWEEVRLDRLRVTVLPQRCGGLSVGLRVRL